MKKIKDSLKFRKENQGRSPSQVETNYKLLDITICAGAFAFIVIVIYKLILI